jgi:hypothetical protein
MNNTHPPQPAHRFAAQRQQAAQLIEAVLDEALAPRLALNRWPPLPPGEPDPSLLSAYQALWHFEADETQQQSEVFYLDAQLELLKQMAHYLARGADLPAYLQRAYPADHTVVFYRDKRVLPETCRLAVQAWQRWRQLMHQALSCLPSRPARRSSGGPATPPLPGGSSPFLGGARFQFEQTKTPLPEGKRGF